MRAAAALFAGCAVALVTPRAWADAEPIHFHYDAPAECPSEGKVVSYAVEMGGTFRTPRPGELARALEVVVRKTDRGYAGNLVVRDISGDERERTVTCGRCESVARALGLFMALALAQPEQADTPERPAPPPANDDTEQDPREIAHDSIVTHQSGGIAVIASWSDLSALPLPSGVAMEGVLPSDGSTHFGLIGALSRDDILDDEGGNIVVAQGLSGRLGAVFAWGAPWTTDTVGVRFEAGVRAGRESGSEWSGFAARPTPGNWCRSMPDSWLVTTPGCLGPSTSKHWSFASPYVAGSLLLQAFPHWAVHPFWGMSALWSADYRGSSAMYGSLEMGLAWRW